MDIVTLIKLGNYFQIDAKLNLIFIGMLYHVFSQVVSLYLRADCVDRSCKLRQVAKYP